ncbi:acyl carrier protein [Streptomyces sp. NPDC002851]
MTRQRKISLLPLDGAAAAPTPTPALASTAPPPAPEPVAAAPVPAPAVPAALHDGFAERVAGEVGEVLAGVLYVEPTQLDPEQSFAMLGVDSILSVEFVALVNAKYGTDIKVTELYDHPTPAAFACHVAARLGDGAPQKPVSQQAVPAPAPGPVPAPAPAPQPVTPAVPAQAAPTPVVALPPAPAPAPAPAHEHRAGAVLASLRQQLAETLCCDIWDIDTEASFNILGLDSILAFEFVAFLNKTYGLDEKAGVLYDHPSLAALAAHIAAHTAPAPAAPVSAPAPADPAAEAGAGEDGISTEALDALLGAVRDNRLTVEQALALLPQRG